MTESSARWHDRIAALPGVTCRAEFGGVACYVGGARFAGITATTLVIHLPPDALIESLRSGHARPFVSVGAMGRNGWVELALATAPDALVDRLVGAAHAAAGHSHRRTIAKRPPAARRTRARR